LTFRENFAKKEIEAAQEMQCQLIHNCLISNVLRKEVSEVNLDMSLLFGMTVGLILGTFFATNLSTYMPLLIVLSVVLLFGHFFHGK